MSITARKRAEVSLREAVRARDEFIAIASHELNTPLSTLRLTTQSLARSLQREPGRVAPEALCSFLQQFERQSSRLERLVDDMLDVGRLNTGRLTMAPCEADLRTVVFEATERMRPQFEAAGVSLKLEAEHELVAFIDPDRIMQLVTNLLTNALRYGRRSPVRVVLVASEEAIELLVEDRGRGIAPEDHERIFGRFERAISMNEASGLGLGLYLARQIAELHRGSIRVESALDEGARFVVTLPRQAVA
jgi:signal transduction histidine kinase